MKMVTHRMISSGHVPCRAAHGDIDLVVYGSEAVNNDFAFGPSKPTFPFVRAPSEGVLW